MRDAAIRDRPSEGHELPALDEMTKWNSGGDKRFAVYAGPILQEIDERISSDAQPAGELLVLLHIYHHPASA